MKSSLEKKYAQLITKQSYQLQDLHYLLISDQQITDQILRIKEQIIYKMAKIYVDTNKAGQIKTIAQNYKFIFDYLPKPKSAKILKNLIQYIEKVPNSIEQQIEMCYYLINWCKQQKRTYLKQKILTRHRIEIKLSNIYIVQQKFHLAKQIIQPLLKDVRKTQDKHLLLQLQLIQSKIYYGLKNYSKAKASLTASRACANSIYCSPLTLAQIDMMSGILYTQQRDFKTGFSYFYQSFQAYSSLNNPKAIYCLKYLLMSKIMMNQKDEINQFINGKYGLKYAGKQLNAMKEVSNAHFEKSLQLLRNVMNQYKQQLQQDKILKSHLSVLYENLLEQNLFKIIEPYNKIQIDYISKKINLSIQIVQNKLSQMILDKKIEGTLDQANNSLIIYDDIKPDSLYPNSLKLIQNLHKTLDKLFQKSKISIKI